jgi:hypothetical protein
MATSNILRTFWIFYDHLAHFVFIWYIFSGFGTMYQKNLATVHSTRTFYLQWAPNPRGGQGYQEGSKNFIFSIFGHFGILQLVFRL